MDPENDKNWILSELYKLLLDASKLNNLIDEKGFQDQFHLIASKIGEIFNFEYCNIGLFENGGILKDYAVWTPNERDEEIQKILDRHKERKKGKTLVGASLDVCRKKELPYFHWDGSTFGELTDENTKYPEFESVDFAVLEDYEKYVFHSNGILNFLVFAIQDQDGENLGYVHLVNQVKPNVEGISKISDSDITIIADFCKYISILLENLRFHRLTYKDEITINEFYQINDIDALMSKLLGYLVQEFNSVTASFLMLARNGFSNDNAVVFLRSIEYGSKAYEKKYQPKIAKVSDAEVAKSLSGRIIMNHESIRKHGEQDDIKFINLTQDKVDILWSFVDESEYVIGIPIMKSNSMEGQSNQKGTPHYERIWGVICLQTKEDYNDDVNRSRLNSIARHIQILLEKAIYKKRFEQIEQLNARLNLLEPDQSKEKLYQSLVNIVRDVSHSECCSLFVADENKKHLVLRATTAKKAYSQLQGDRTPIDVPAIIKSKKPIYSIGEEGNSGITGRVFNREQAALVYDIERNPLTHKAFVEETDNVHKSIVAILLRGAGGEKIGVLRCVNKKDKGRLLSVFVDGDFKLINLIANISIHLILNHEYQQRQYLAMTHFAHESRIPMQAVKDDLKLLVFQLERNARKIPDGILETLNSLELNSSILMNNVLTAEYVFLSDRRNRKQNFEKTSLKKLINGLKKTFSDKKIRTLISRAPDLYIDESQILRVFYNLIINAIRYSRVGSEIVIVYDEETNYPHEGWHRFSFRNEGIGIMESEAELIFTSFYRSENAKKKYQTGTGIGLKVCRDIMEFHDGEIKVTQFNHPTEISIFFKPYLVKSKPEV